MLINAQNSATSPSFWPGSQGANPPIDVGGCYDFRPAVAQVVDRILAPRAAAPQVQPLFVLMGEEHTQSAHVVMQQMIVAETLRRVRDTHRIAFGYEAPHNRQQVSRGEAPEANQSLNAFLQAEKISIRFNDAAICVESLDLYDSLTASAARTYYAYKTHFDSKMVHRAQCHAECFEGVAIRNNVIRILAQEHAYQSGASIYFQSTGALHLYGGSGDGFTFPFFESLYARFKRTSQSFLWGLA